MAPRMAKLSTIKTLAGFDFSFQPSLDKNRILAPARLDFIDCNVVIYFLGPIGTGKSHLATALGVEADKAGRSVYFASLADIIGARARSPMARVRSISRAPRSGLGLITVPLPQPYAWATAVLVDEFDAGEFERFSALPPSTCAPP